jgi:putative ABC transport system permease protein
MAWRDSRRSRQKLLFFSLSIVLGIAAMVAIGSFGRSLENAVEQQTKALLGADLLVQSRDVFTGPQKEFLDALPATQSEQILFSSMVYFPKADGTRLAQVGGLSGDFPYYGEVETFPTNAWTQFKRGEGALVEESLLHQFDAEVGDNIKVGELTLPILGALRKVPGDNEFFASLAPRVFLRMESLAATELLGDASLARYRRFLQFDTEAQLESAVTQLRDRRDELQLRFDTVEERKENLGEALRNLYRFLNLGGFVALLLGSIGIASAIQVHVRQRLDSVAILRCLGATSGQAFTIYLIQGAALGLAGVIAGTALGVGLQQALPLAFANFIPIEVEFAVDTWSALRAAGAGFLICMLFALLPLLQVRTVSPLAVFRRDLDHVPSRDPWLYVVYGAIAIGVVAFALSQTQRWQHGVAFAGGLAGALLVLFTVARLIVWAVRKMKWKNLPFPWRQGLASLHRPNNRTLLLMVSLGLGTFLILTLHLVQHSIVRELMPENQASKPNAVLFDIQSDQKDGILKLLEEQNLPALGVSPVVTMRIASVKGRSTEDLIKEKKIRNWVLRREYRSTYRDHIADSEEMISGEWVATASPGADVISISMERGIAEDLGVGVGDEIVFDVQGIPVTTRIANLRKVDWRRVQANFFVVFPSGILEEAPGFFIVTTRIQDSQQSAAMQRVVVKNYPNVSTIDFTVVLKVVEGIVEKISFGIRFMALFTVFTGIILLITAVLNSRFQRLRETILLRTLGASSGQVMRIQVIEFLLLGFLASLTGIGLAVGAHFLLTTFVFKVGFSVPVLHLALAIVLNCLLTLSVGLLASRTVLKRPPLEILREQG